MLSALTLNPALALWLFVMVATIIAQRWFLGPGNALVGAYLVNSWLIYWPGALIYALPWYLGSDGSLVRAGFLQSLYGVLAFGGGTVLTTLALRAVRKAPDASRPIQMEPGLARSYIIVGLISTVVVYPFSQLVPSLTAIVSMTNMLVVVGMALRSWQAIRDGDGRTFMLVLLAGVLLPIFTIGVWGFASFGASAFSFLLLFAFSLIRMRARLLITSLLLVYFALSAYVTYYRDRSAIREVVWGGAGLQQRGDTIFGAFLTLEPFDLRNREHLYSIDERLNQNTLVGAAIMHLDLGYADYVEGATLWNAAVALIPRILWPNKPLVAGGNDLVSSFTGIEFDRNTSVGIGQVMEFYINFGSTGVVVGFFLLGAIIASFDWFSARALQRGDGKAFALWFLCGLGLLQVNGALFEMSASVFAGLVAIVLVHRLLPLLGMGTSPSSSSATAGRSLH